MNDSTIWIVKILLITGLIFTSSLLKPRFFSYQYNCIYPVSLILVASIANYFSSNLNIAYSNTGSYLIDFLLILGTLPIVFILTVFNIIFGVMDGAIFKFILNFNLNQSILTICLLSVTLHMTEAFQAASCCESWNFYTLLSKFKDGLLCASERLATHVVGTSILYYLLA
jgi:hypothetical protein